MSSEHERILRRCEGMGITQAECETQELCQKCIYNVNWKERCIKAESIIAGYCAEEHYLTEHTARTKAEIELAELKSRIGALTVQWLYNFISENSSKYFHYDTLKETFSDKFHKTMAEVDIELSKKLSESIISKLKGE